MITTIGKNGCTYPNTGAKTLGTSGIVNPRQIKAFASAPPNNPKKPIPNEMRVVTMMDIAVNVSSCGSLKVR